MSTKVIRIYWDELGDHTHLRVFAGSAFSHSLGKCGDLVMRHDEWALLKLLVQESPNVALVHEASLHGSERSGTDSPGMRYVHGGPSKETQRS